MRFDRVIGDLIKHAAEMEFWIDAVQFRRANKLYTTAARSPPESEPANR
jgi:hypothetical protein